MTTDSGECASAGSTARTTLGRPDKSPYGALRAGNDPPE
jgi:hypothetical protein